MACLRVRQEILVQILHSRFLMVPTQLQRNCLVVMFSISIAFGLGLSASKAALLGVSNRIVAESGEHSLHSLCPVDAAYLRIPHRNSSVPATTRPRTRDAVRSVAAVTGWGAKGTCDESDELDISIHASWGRNGLMPYGKPSRVNWTKPEKATVER